MFNAEITELLQKSLPTLPVVVCEHDLSRDIDELVASQFPRMKLALIQDHNTEATLGARVFRALKDRFETTLVTLSGSPQATMDIVDYITSEAKNCDALIAVGSGTISDLCKYAAHRDNKPYLIFPTAASMNGYLSANASISVGGYKQTLPASMPQAIFCDVSVIAKAPARLHRSGLGDSLARPTAQADWLMSHLLLGTPYSEVPFTLLTNIEGDLFQNARGLALSDTSTVKLLLETLLLSGLGMTIAGGSYPASQSEHMLAHTMHMLQGIELPPTYHGEEIGITTLTVSRLQEQLYRRTPTLLPTTFNHETITALFGPHIADEAQKTYHAKRDILEHLSINKNTWSDIAHTLEKITIPSPKIEAILKAAQAPIMPESLGWPEAAYDTALTHARFLRDRFTCLDLTA